MSDDDWGTMAHMFQTVQPQTWTRLLGTAYEVLLETDHNVTLRYGVEHVSHDGFEGVKIRLGVEGTNGSRALLTVRVPEPSERPLRLGSAMIRKAVADLKGGVAS